MQRIQKQKNKYNRGFALFLASLIASLMLALGVAMFTIAQKQVRISSIARESQFAFYAADAAAECALYLHFVRNAFATTTDFAIDSSTKCDGKALLSTNFPPANPKTSLGGHDNVDGAGRYITTFIYDLDGVNSKKYCVSIQVRRDDNNKPHTQINALGYNVSCLKRVDPNQKRILERAVRMNL